MTKLFVFVLLLATLNAAAQNRSFTNTEAYGEWIMQYQENPKPEELLPAFEFGITNPEVARLGVRNLVIAFFGSLFRADSTLVPNFYELASRKNSHNFHYGFTGALWMANTPYTRIMLSSYLQLAASKKYNNTGFSKRPYDIYHDAIKDATHLDLIWADFFATGNPANIKKIVSALDTDEHSIAEAAKWSLTSNGKNYSKVYELISQELRENTHDTLKQKLAVIKSTIDKQ